MIAETFASGTSWIHTIDPRYRVAAAVGYSIVVALSTRLPALVAALTISILLLLLARLDLKVAGRRLGVLAGFVILIWAILPLTMPGPPLYQIGSLVLTRTGAVLALQITLKSIAILAAMMALVATMTVATLGQSLNRLGVAKKIVYLLLITYRYVFVLEEEYRRLLTAARIRCFRPRTNIHSYRTYAYLIGMLFVRAAVRSQRVHQAMKCRGFSGKFYSLYTDSPNPRNRIFAFMAAFTLTGLAILEWGGLQL